MLPQVNRILYTTDLGDDTRPVFRYAVSLARVYRAKLHLLHIVEPLSDSDRFLVEAYLSTEMETQAEKVAKKFREETSQHVLDKIRNRVEKFCAEEMSSTPDELDLIGGIEVLTGSPAEVIVREAEARDMDIIVVGTHARSPLKRILMGSTARKVTVMSNKPVLVVPLHGTATWET